jgi:flagellar FliL protein
MSTSAAAGGKEAKAGKSKMVPILLVVILLLLAGGGAGGYFLYKRSSTPAVAVVPPPVFFALEPFTVNLASDPDGDGSDHYLHLGLTFKIGSAKEEHTLTEYLPEVRSHILLLLSSKKPSDLSTVAGKQKLSDELRTTVEKTFEHESTPPKISGVLLTDFVIQ